MCVFVFVCGAPCIPSERKSNQLDMNHSGAAGESVLFAEIVWYCRPPDIDTRRHWLDKNRVIEKKNAFWVNNLKFWKNNLIYSGYRSVSICFQICQFISQTGSVCDQSCWWLLPNITLTLQSTWVSEKYHRNKNRQTDAGRQTDEWTHRLSHCVRLSWQQNKSSTLDSECRWGIREMRRDVQKKPCKPH